MASKVASVTVEVWVLVNSEGEYVAHEDAGVLAEEYEERIGEMSAAEGLRRVCVKVTVPLPTPIELVGEASVDEESSLRYP